MPAFRHGRSAVVKIDDASGTLRDLSPYVDSVTFSNSVETADVTAYGNNSRAFINGLRNATLSISGHWAADATTGPDTVLGTIFANNGGLSAGGSLSFEVGPEGSATGRVKYTGECFLTSYETSVPVGDKVSFSAEFQVTGDVTRGSY